MISGPRYRHKRAGELDQSAAADVRRSGVESGPGGQVGRAEGSLDVLGPDAGPEDTAGRVVREVSRVVRRPERRVCARRLVRGRRRVGRRRAQALGERVSAVRPTAEHRRKILAPERKSEHNIRYSLSSVCGARTTMPAAWRWWWC